MGLEPPLTITDSKYNNQTQAQPAVVRDANSRKL